MRMQHEATQHEDNCFITLTYDQDHLPKDGSLNPDHWRLFMYKLRQEARRLYGKKIRFFMCGEYGEQLSRPHYHACLFGFDFPDRELFKPGKNAIWLSPLLSKKWEHGFHTIQRFTPATAAYVAGYVTKKITGEKAGTHYSTAVDYSTGECLPNLLPEFCRMSRNPGIGKDWYDLYKDEIWDNDSVIYAEHERRPPVYYERLLSKDDPELLQKIKDHRRVRAKKHKQNLTPERLAVRDKYARKMIAAKKRNYEVTSSETLNLLDL